MGKAIDDLFLELSSVSNALTKKERSLLDAVQKAYRKHCMGDESIGWEELDDILLNALCNAMGDAGYQQWLRMNKR